MAKLYYDHDAKWEVIKDKHVAVIGYGSQGHAHALNRRVIGVKGTVWPYAGIKAWHKAEQDGLNTTTVHEAVAQADVVMMLLPDEKQAAVYRQEVAPYLKKGTALAFAHGFNIHYGQIQPPADVDVFMVAPKGPGHLVRRTFTEGKGVPCLFAVYHDSTGMTEDLALAYARGIGGTRAGALSTTFAEETETDLFGEQAILCGGLTELVCAGFETLTAAGYQPELAYFECLHEMKLIVDLMYEGGMAAMRYSISDTAEFGDYVSGPRIINGATRAEMRKMLAEIQDGTFAKQWILENQANRPAFNALRRKKASHPIEIVGKELRAMMPWLKKN